jgi:DNA-binding MarR family transcriptional regulator
MTASRALVGVSVRSLEDLGETVTVAQFRTLVVLDTHGEIHLNRLAEILGVNASSAMRMVDRLLAAGLVSRREKPADRRHTLISLTRRGEALVRRVTARRRRELTKLVSRMPTEHGENLVEALRAFAAVAGEPAVPGSDGEVSALGW